ncbi:MAG TPA: bifunctional DNA primase/polymerase [Terracidiphilus sp.]|jgi:hypothetical protein|nr:bifunctional DNA primase/polymerase [Terracidiphilus sp.]
MKSVDLFLRQLERQKCFARLPITESNVPTAPKTLPPEVRLGLDLGWKMALFAAGSQWASSCASVCPPTSEISSLESLYGRFPNCNWVLLTGRASDVVAVSFHIDLAREALHILSEQSDVWRRTLRLRSGRKVFLLFSHPGARIPARRTFEGIRIHCGNTIYVPPSLVSGETLRYRDPLARPLEMPDLSLLEQPECTFDFDHDCEY